jgi:hydroxyacylglutathione hydrolase
MARLLVLRASSAHASARFNVGPGTPIPLRVTAQSLGPYGTNCFIVSSAGTGEALVIDPGAEPDRIRRSLQASGLRCAAILVTHAHHVGPLARDGSSPVYASRGEASILSAPSTGLDSGLGPIDPHDPEVLLDGGERLQLAGLDVEVLAVPGHSPAALAFRITDPADGDEQVFVGDVIFAGSVGRTDFPGSSWPVLEHSILALYDAVGLDVPIHPGHGPSTTLGRERATNPFLDAVRAR